MFELSKLDPKALTKQFQAIVEEQVGGAPMKVELHKFEQTNPGYTDNRVFISFAVTEHIMRNYDTDDIFGIKRITPIEEPKG